MKINFITDFDHVWFTQVRNSCSEEVHNELFSANSQKDTGDGIVFLVKLQAQAQNYAKK